jgi:hypothetical protein
MFMLLASVGMAQNANQVTLKFDDGTGISGELLEFANDTFRIQAHVGLIVVPADGVFCIGAACPEGTLLEVESAAVTLISLDGTQQLSGDVIEVVNGEYVLATDFGEVRIGTELVKCEGVGCVDSQISKEVVLSDGSVTLEGTLLELENGAYIIDVEALGQIRVDANQFECSGEACP